MLFNSIEIYRIKSLDIIAMAMIMSSSINV